MDENEDHIYANEYEQEMLKQNAGDFWQLHDNLICAILTNKPDDIVRLVENGGDLDVAMQSLFGFGNLETFKTFEYGMSQEKNKDVLESNYFNLVKLAYEKESDQVIDYLHNQVFEYDALSAIIWLHEEHDSINMEFAKKHGKAKVQNWLLSLELENNLDVKKTVKKTKL